MTLANVANTATFGAELSAVNQLIVLMNLFTDGASNANIFFANTINGFSWIAVSGMNVKPTIQAAFSAANSAFAQANISLPLAGGTVSGNVVLQANMSMPIGNTGILFGGGNHYIYSPLANTIAFVTSNLERVRIMNDGQVNVNVALTVAGTNVVPTIQSAYGATNAAFSAANSAFAQANLSSGTTAFSRANNSFGNVFITGTNSGYTWTGAGNLGLVATNSANTAKLVAGAGIELDVDQGNNAILFVTSSFSAANSGFLAANSAFAAGNTNATATTAAFSAANSSFSNGNTNFVVTVAAFSAANSAFGTANAALTSNANTRHYSIGVGTPASGSFGEIRASGDITAFFSDDRLKVRIENLGNALESVATLDGFRYKMSAVAGKYGFNTDRIDIGLSAQQVQKVLPEAVTFAPFDTGMANGEFYSKSGENYLTLKYERVIPLLVQAIKEIKNKLEDLDYRVSELEDDSSF